MSIESTKASMAFAERADRLSPSCASCGLRYVITERVGSFLAGSLKCTKGGFMTNALSGCNRHTPGEAMSRDPSVQGGSHAR